MGGSSRTTLSRSVLAPPAVKFCAFPLLFGGEGPKDGCFLAAGGRRVRVLGAGVRVLRLLRALRWEEGLPGCRHGALHSSGNYPLACPLFLADRVNERVRG